MTTILKEKHQKMPHKTREQKIKFMSFYYPKKTKKVVAFSGVTSFVMSILVENTHWGQQLFEVIFTFLYPKISQDSLQRSAIITSQQPILNSKSTNS